MNHSNSKKQESRSAMEKRVAAADSMDERRQLQIKNQSVRMDSMKEIILYLAREVYSFEVSMLSGSAPPRSISQIIGDASGGRVE